MASALLYRGLSRASPAWVYRVEEAYCLIPVPEAPGASVCPEDPADCSRGGRKPGARIRARARP